MRRDVTEITERNGGVHRQPALRRVRSMLFGHGFTRPRLYHLVLLDHAAESPNSTARFQGAIKALCRKLRHEGIATRWRAALEREAEKGLHCHVFLLVEDTGKVNPCSIINAKRDTSQAWLHRMLSIRHMDFHLAQPKADMHRVGGTIEGRRNNYATLAGDKLADCLTWVSYLVKQRSKSDDFRTTYLSSRDSKYLPGAPLPTAQTKKPTERRPNQYRRARCPGTEPYAAKTRLTRHACPALPLGLRTDDTPVGTPGYRTDQKIEKP